MTARDLSTGMTPPGPRAMLSARGPRLRKSGRGIALCAVLLVAAPGFGQSVGSREQLLRLEEQIRRQQDQIEELRAALEEQAGLVKALQGRLPSTVEQPATEAGGAPLVTKSPTTVGTEKFNLKASGFMEATAMVRSRNQNADVGETFGNVPLDGTANSFLSSFRMSSRHSRLSLLASARLQLRRPRVLRTDVLPGKHSRVRLTAARPVAMRLAGRLPLPRRQSLDLAEHAGHLIQPGPQRTRNGCAGNLLPSYPPGSVVRARGHAARMSGEFVRQLNSISPPMTPRHSS